MIHTSVIIPTFESPWLKQIASALHRQSYDLNGTEVLIIGFDDAARDLEDDLIRYLPSKDPIPPAQARNVGIRKAQGKLICFLDADCIPETGWLSSLTGPYRFSEVEVVGGTISFPLDYWTLADSIAHFGPVIAGSGYDREIAHLPTLNFSARRSVFARAGLFDEAFQRPSGEDTELTKRFKDQGIQLQLAKDALVFHAARRRGPIDLLVRSVHHGQAAAVPSYRKQLLQESALFRWPLLLITAVPRALAVTFQIYRSAPGLRRYWYAAPMVFLIKLTWIVSVAIALMRTRRA